MSVSQLYLDLVEIPIKKWVSIFCNMDCAKYGKRDNPIFMDEYCLIFPEKIDGIPCCIILYVDLDYPPFNDRIEFEVKREDSNYLDVVINAIEHCIPNFYLSVAQTLINGKISEAEILKNTRLIFDMSNYTYMPYPIDNNFIEKNKHLYEKLNIAFSKDRTKQEIFNKYSKEEVRICINVEILKGIKIPISIKKELLSNYKDLLDYSSDDSE